ncbi:MAG: PVC-type heme-binding CxxCH protein, partial [Terriglobia bacterium]
LDHHAGAAPITAAVTQVQHPVTREVSGFETTDEPYLFKNLTADRTVLMDRAEGSRREPLTWVRNQGKGRVLYTAFGHDENTWKKPEFQALIRGAVLWTAGDAVRARWEELDMPSVNYRTSGNIPNYERRVPPPKYQSPLSPQDSMKTMQVPPGFEVQLFASEPDIVKPISMNWDERGRLWIIESVDYPNEIHPGTPGRDRIKICEDTDGDGKADKFTIFAEGLNIPTALTFYKGGVIVGSAPDILYLKDTDGDDKADVREVLSTGWGTRDTHSGIGNLKWGFDNQIWGSVGYSGFTGKSGDKTLNFSQGLFRMHPDGTGLEFTGAFSNNTWGLGFTETFDVFGSTANNTHAVYVGIPPRYSADVKGLPLRPGSKKIDGHYFMAPLTPNVRQVDVQGGFTAAAGFNFYTARAYPKEYWDRIAFVNEPTGRVVHRAILEKKGAGFTEKDGWNLLASSDDWFAPVLTEVGPDGMVWVDDWYNFIVQHNPTPVGFKNGRGGAYINPLRDQTRGRIYRIVYTGAPAHKPMSLSASRPTELLAALSNDNMFWRLQAQRLLVERGQTDIAPQLIQLARSSKTDEIGLNPGALHALWTMQGLGMLNGSNPQATAAAVAALKSPTAGVRKAALQVLPANDATLKAIRAAGLLKDPDPYTRLTAILFLTQMPPSDEIGAEIYALGKTPEIANDEFLSMAAHDAAVRHRAGYLKAFESDLGSEPFQAMARRLAIDEATPKQLPAILPQTQQGPQAGLAAAEPRMPVSERLLRAYVEDVVGPIKRPPPPTGGRGGGGRGQGQLTGTPFDVAIGIDADKMTYTLPEFTAKPNQYVRITLKNTADVQHNVVVLRPNTEEKVGLLVEAMAKVQDAEERSYLPSTPDILFWMTLIEPGQSGVLEFAAPNQAGDYPYICTFPGHWQTMKGIMHVKP